MSIYKTFVTAALALVIGVPSRAVADELLVEKCTILKAGAGAIWVVGPCEQPVPFRVDPSAKITLDGKPARLGDLPPGATAVITLRRIEGGVIVVRIDAELDG